MEQLLPAQIAMFVKRFRFSGGTLRVFRIRNRPPHPSVAEIRVTVQEIATKKRVRLRLLFEGVEEYRFQQRPGHSTARLREVRLGYFHGSFYLNLDAFADDGPLAVHDFRASDAFIAGQRLSWEIVPPKKSPDSSPSKEPH